MTLSNQTLIIIGGTVVAGLCWLFKQWIQSFFSQKMDDLKKLKEDDIAERKADMALQFEGQAVIADCLHETMYAVINGHHNGGLAQCDAELQEYRKNVNHAMTQKAVNWNVQDGGRN